MRIIPEKGSQNGVAAEDYANSGQVVFPLGRDDGKRPLVRWSGLQPGPRHVLQVRCYWRKWPDANIGLRTGFGLAVLDIDPRHGGVVDQCWPATRASQTRSGGVHLFYRSARPVRCSAGLVAPGVDVRGEGGYVVAPPSPGWSWLNDLPFAEFPHEVVANAVRQRAKTAGGPGGPGFELLEDVPRGERNSYLARMTGWLLSQDIPEIDAGQMLHEYNAAYCSPPLDPAEVDQILVSIARYHR